MSSFCRVRSISYSLLASSAEVSLIATTYPLRCANRTRWREIPFGRAAMVSSGHRSSGRLHGRSSSAESTVAEVMLRLMRAPNQLPIEPVEILRSRPARSADYLDVDGSIQAQAGLAVEDVDVVRLRKDEHLVAGVRVVASIHARHDVDAGAVNLGVAVQVAVGAEFLDDVNLNGKALTRRGDLHVFGADADGHALRGGLVEHIAADLRHRGAELQSAVDDVGDRKSTRLNSSHVRISYAVF